MDKQEKIKLFKSFVYEYRDMIGLRNYGVYVFSQKKESKASWVCDNENRLVSIFYSEWWIESVTDEVEIQKTAFHEVFEAGFSEIQYNLKRYYSEDYVNSLIHEQVRRIENIMFKQNEKF